MAFGFTSIKSTWEFRFYFPNASHPSPVDYMKVIPLDTTRLVLIIAFSVLLVVGILANGWVARVVLTVLRQTSTEASRAVQIFILALCACDCLVLAFLSLLLMDLWYGQWVVPSRFLCRCYLMSESLSKFYAPFLLVELSGFCYFGVKYRQQIVAAFSCATRSDRRTTKAASAAVIAALLLAFAFMVPVYMHADIYYLILYNESDVYGVMTKCAFQPPEYIMSIFTMYSFICGYLIPACLFTIFYVAVLLYVHKRRRKSSCTTGKSMDYFSKIAKTSFGLVFFYFVSWTPFWLMALYHYLSPVVDYEEISDGSVIMSYIIHMLPYINCNAYPLLYTLMNRSIQHDYLRACERSRSLRQRRRLSFSGGSERSKSSFFRKSFLSRHNSVRSDPNSIALAATDHPLLFKNASFVGSTASLPSASRIARTHNRATLPSVKGRNTEGKSMTSMDTRRVDDTMPCSRGTEVDQLLHS